MRPRFRKIIKITFAVFALLIVLLLSFAYVQYRELKKVLLLRLSEKATSFAGQKVEIEDLSFSPSAGINLYNIRIKNPGGFTAGDLLRIKKLFIKMKYGDLPKGKLYFTNIIVHSPELTVLRDEQGRMNISAELMNFFKRKPTLTYQIDEFEIKSGSVDFNQNKYLAGNNIALSLKDIASETGHKTTIQGNISFAQLSRIDVEGWAYLRDEPKRLNISMASKDSSLVPFKELLNQYGMDVKRTKIIFSLTAAGDTANGLQITSELGIKETGFALFKKEVKEILLTMKAFLNIRDSSVALENISLQSGGITSATLKGELRKVKEDIVYTAMLKISVLDLSAFNFMKDVKVRGIITSDNVRVRGSLKKPFSEISGIVQLRNGAFSSQETDIGGINAQATFSQGKGMAVRMAAVARISKVKGYLLDEPAGADVQITASGGTNDMELLSSIDLSPVAMHIKGEKPVHAENLSLDVKSNIKGKTFSGESLVKMKGIRYDTYQTPWLRGSTAFAYSGNIMTIKNPTIQGEDFSVSAKQLILTLPEKKTTDTVAIKMEDMNASYFKRKAEVRNAALSLKLNTGNKALSGDLGFSIGEIMFGGVRAGLIQGSSSFDDKYFSLDITGAEVSGGNIRLSAKGRYSGGPFPLTAMINAENIDLENLSGEALRIANMPYVISGNIISVNFEGTVDSQESVKGEAEIKAEKISLIRKDKKNIVQGISLKGGITFRGNNLDFNSNLNAGKISANISGSLNRFTQVGRIITAEIIQPEADMADIREAFWDTFPDKLLYAGLQGSLSSDVSIQYGDSELKVNGKLKLKDLVLRGENGEYSVGPINGVLPVAYAKTGDKQGTVTLPSFESAEFDSLSKYYARKTLDDSYNQITIDSLNYGFKFLDDIDIRIKKEGNVLNIGRFSGNIFGGRLYGSAVIDISNGLAYRAGLLVEGLSLMKLCDGIEPIQGYLSGKVSGVANIKGTGTGIENLIGKADAWTYSTPDEKTKLSKEFLHKIGGPSLKAYLGDREFDKGNMSVYLQDGYIIFRELEISNRNIFGMQDLSIKVAPLNNRIAIDHLMWAVVEAASRAKKE